MSKQIDCLQSTVRNSTSGTKFFAFLPPHGRTIAAGDELTFDGDIRELVARPGRYNRGGGVAALMAAMEAGELDIVGTPAPVMIDGVTGHSRMLVLNNNVLTTDGPCWDSSED